MGILDTGGYSPDEWIVGGPAAPQNLLFGAHSAAEAATQAANIQMQTAELGIAETQRQFDITQETLAPAIGAGDLARDQQQALLGLLGPEAQAQALSQMQDSPAQQFIRKRAQKNLLQNASAIGGLGGGNVRTALVEQGAGFASQDMENQFGRLQDLSAPGTRTGVQQSQLGQQSASQVANLLGTSGAAQASGILGAQQAQSQAQGQAVGTIASVGGYLLSDKNMKTEVKDLDLKECYETVLSMDLKAWRYLESAGLDTDQHYGPIAQNAPECIRAGKVNGVEMLDLHDELMLMAGAIQHMKNEGIATWRS